MRRYLAATVLVGTFFLATACSDGDKPDTGTPAPTAGGVSAPATAAGTAAPGAAVPTADPSVAASGDKALSANTKAICAQADRTTKNFGQTFLADLKVQIDAASQGAEAKAEAQQKIDRDVQSFSAALQNMGTLTADPQLKNALTAMGKQVTALKGDLTAFNAEKMGSLTSTLEKACGKG
jgi:hypothetical protein